MSTGSPAHSLLTRPLSVHPVRPRLHSAISNGSLFAGYRVFAFKGQNITFTVNVLLTRIVYNVTPGPAMIRAVCEYSRLILITVASCHICTATCSFGDAVALLRESYTLAQRNSHVSCSYLIELMFLELDVQVYSSFDLSSPTGFKFNLLRASLLTVLRVAYAVVRLNSSGKTIVSILHVDLISCRYF